MSEIYSPGSLAGPQGPIGPAGSQGSVTALASSALPAMTNLFDQSKVTANFTLNADGSLSASANWNTTGMIFCPGVTSMVTNMPVTLFQASMVLYDANGSVTATLSAADLGAAYNAGFSKMNADAAFALPGTQVYIRFAYVPSWYGNGYAANDAAAMIIAVAGGTATLPASYCVGGLDTAADVNSKIAVAMASVSSQISEFAAASLPGAASLGQRNAFDYTKVQSDSIVGATGAVTASSGWETATIYCPFSTEFITNIGFYAVASSYYVCSYDAQGNFIADITASLASYLEGTTNRVKGGSVGALAGNQTYIKFSYVPSQAFNAYAWAGSAGTAVFYAGTVANPVATSLTPANASQPFPGNQWPSVMRASQLGCATDKSLDATPLMNAFLATASSTNPIKLILDAMYLTQGLVISPNGYTTIEGLGAGTGLLMFNESAQDMIRIGTYTAAAGDSEGTQGTAAPVRTAKNITLRNFQIVPNNLPGENGQAGALANQPVSGAIAHATYGIILANATDIVLDGLVFLEQCDTYAVVVSNVARVKAINCSFTSTGVLHDGIHIDGPAESIQIANCYFSTGDDAIALNAPEGWGGDITDVAVTNCVFDGSLSFMRLYTSSTNGTASAGPWKIRKVAFSNCVGWCTNYGFTVGIYGGGYTPVSGADQVEDFSIANCTLSSTTNPMMFVVDYCGHIRISGVNWVPQTASPVVDVLNSVAHLTLDGVTILRNPDGNAAPETFVRTQAGGSIGKLSLGGCRVADEAGSSYAMVPCLVDAVGSIATVQLEDTDLAHITSIQSSAGWSNITLLRGAGVMGTAIQVPDSVMDNNALYLSSDAGGAPSIKVGGTAKRLTLA